MLRFALAFVFLAGTAQADGCPVAPDHTAAMNALIEQMQAAKGNGEARVLSNQMWQYLLDAPDEPSQALLDKALNARQQFDYVRALDKLNRLVSYCPFYAEGYNQRAFVNYLRENYEQAVPDLLEAIKINPKHIGALAGLALTYFALNEDEKGQEALRRAVALNPWLSERFLLTEPEGQEL